MTKKTSKTAKRGGRKPGTWISGMSIDAIKNFRRNGKLSRSKLAEILSVSSTTIQNWETGRVIPMRVYQEELKKIIKGDAPREVTNEVSNDVVTAERDNGPVESAACEATVKIVSAYLQSGRAKLNPDQLCKLVRGLRVAMR